MADANNAQQPEQNEPSPPTETLVSLPLEPNRQVPAANVQGSVPARQLSLQNLMQILTQAGRPEMLLQLQDQQQLQRLLQTDNSNTSSELQQVVVDNQTQPQENQNTPTTNNSNNVPEDQRISVTTVSALVFKIFPALLIPLLLFTYQYYMGFLVGLWLFVVTLTTNERIKQQVALKTQRQTIILVALMVISFAQIAVVFFLFIRERLWYHLIYSANVLNFYDNVWAAVWITTTIDFVVKIFGMALKCVCIILIGGFDTCISPIQKGRIYTLLEYVIQLYRVTLPPAVWMHYLLGSKYNFVFAVFVLILYYVYKTYQIVERLYAIFKTLRSMFKTTPTFGRYVTTQDLQTNHADEECPICKEEYTKPIMLECNHAFCEECASQWLQTQNTCPICRAKVKKAGQAIYHNGSSDLWIMVL